MEDIAIAAEHIKQGYTVVNNQWMFVNSRIRSAGGFGVFSDRESRLRDEASYLLQRYPGIVKLMPETRNNPAGTHVGLSQRNKPVHFVRMDRAEQEVLR